MANEASGRMGTTSKADPGKRLGSGRQSGNLFFPLLLLAIAVCASLLSRSVQLWTERAGLDARLAEQGEAFDQSKRLRQQLDGVAIETIRLARRGNPNAAKVVEELGRLGITIDPDAPPAQIPE